MNLPKLLCNNSCRILKPFIGNGSFQRIKWHILQRAAGNRKLTFDKKLVKSKFSKGKNSSPGNRSGVCLTSGLVCGTGYVLRSILLSPAWRQVQCEGGDNVAQFVTEYIDKNYPKLKWRDFWRIISSEIWLILAAAFCAILAAVINVKIPLLLGDVIEVLTHASSQTSDFFTEITDPAKHLMLCYIAHAAWTFSYISLITKVGERISKKLRVELFTALMRQDISFYDERKTGEVLNRLTSDIQDFKTSFKQCLSIGLKALTQTIGCTVSLVMVSPQLCVSICTLLACIVTVGSVFGIELRHFARRAQEQMAKATGVATEAVNNVRTVRAFAMEPKEVQMYDCEVKKSSRLNMQLGFGIATFQALSNLTINGILLSVLYCGGLLMSSDLLTPGELMSFLVATQTIQKSLAQMSVLFGQVVKGVSAGGRVVEFIMLKPDIPLTDGEFIPYHQLYGHIVFNNVRFVYPSRPNQTVIKDLNLDIIGGETVALVGPSGGGKSTIAALLERFYDINSGIITIDGHNLKDLDPSWIRGKAIGYINQEPVLFTSSIMENIRYGQPTATDVEVKEAALLANAHDFIMQFPDGYDTTVGERGVTLSGGQKQRIAIARALIKNPSILILDEATSSLDAESEMLVQNALDRVSKGRTVLVIAHRLSTVKNADKIAVVSDGEIVESGNHETLCKKKGIYWELIRQQAVLGPRRVPATVSSSLTGVDTTDLQFDEPLAGKKKPGIIIRIWNWFKC